MARQTRLIYEFDVYRLDQEERLLWRDGQIVALTPKAFDTLLALVENSRHVMTKEALLERIWPDAFVEEGNLAQHISFLRKALGALSSGGPLIETVSKRGYRFAVPVKKVRVEPTQTGTQLVKKTPADDAVVTAPLGFATSAANAEAGAAAASWATGAQLGRYEILSRIGAGGMGEVYAAHDKQLERRVALKLLAAEYTGNPRWRQRFLREAKAASALNHPNIVTIHEVGCEQQAARETYFIATEFVEGQTLRQRLTQGRLPVLEALPLLLQLTSALAAAHQAGLVHRDVKPENLMLRPDGYLKVLDFGLAKPLRPEQASAGAIAEAEAESGAVITDPGVVLGTVNYMSPEQARGLEVDARSDIFSAGIVCHEMLTGVAPFDGATPSDVLVAILTHEPPLLVQVLGQVPTELERIVTKALRKDREERYQTMRDLHLDVKTLLHELELQAQWQAQRQGTRASFGSDTTPSPKPEPTQRIAAHYLETRRSGEAQRIPEVRYTRSGEVNLAYQVFGEGAIDLVFVMGWVSHLEWFWEEPSFARFLRRLASFARVVLFDKRGTGLSDRVPVNELPTLEQRMDDVRAVLEAVGAERAVLCGISEGGPMSCLFAATYPAKTSALVMIGSYARRMWAEDYPWGPTAAQWQGFLEEIRRSWGGPVGIEARAPSLARDANFREWWASYLRMGASPGAALALTQMNAQIDVRPILPTIQVPTLVIHRTGDECLRVEEGRYLAGNIPGAKFVELPGRDHLPFVGAQDEILDEIEEFLTGVRHATAANRVLATVLVVAPLSRETTRAELERQQAHAAREIELFRGRAIELADRVLAIFDGPARGIRAACAIRDSARRLGLGVRIGLHTGECDVWPVATGKQQANTVSGNAVELAIHLAQLAAPAQILVSSTTKDLVAGSGLSFEKYGLIECGALGEWQLFTVAC